MDEFILLIKDEKLPIPETEYKFCKDRKWRFDYAYPIRGGFVFYA